MLAEQVVDADGGGESRGPGGCSRPAPSCGLSPQKACSSSGARGDAHAVAQRRIDRDAAIEGGARPPPALPQLADEAELGDPQLAFALALRRHRHAQRRDDGQHHRVGRLDGEQRAHLGPLGGPAAQRLSALTMRPSSSTMALAPVTDTMRPIERSLLSEFRLRRDRTSCCEVPSCPRSSHARCRAAHARCPCMSDTSNREGRVTVTSVPSDLALRISRRPPCSCTSALAIGRPSPVPSRQRERLASTWAKGVRATAISSAASCRARCRARTRPRRRPPWRAPRGSTRAAAAA